jgi:1-acyl-sn-glycerol-3-phosphate acyltransferase
MPPGLARPVARVSAPHYNPPRMGQVHYVVGKFFARWIYALSIKGVIVRPELAEREGGYVLACTHISHLEPFIVSTIVNRNIDWMARVEFYRWRLFRYFLDRMDAFPVNRFGVPVSAIRTAIARAKAGKVVGIFPEGGVAMGKDSACRGGAIKRGACLVSMRADVPIVPCVLLGTHELNSIEPWLPYRRATLWIAFGEPIHPVRDAPSHRAGRAAMSRQLSDAFASLYRELCERYDIPKKIRET